MTTPLQHGIFVTELVSGVRNLATVASSVIGLVAVAPDADPVVFPLNVATLVTDLPAAIGSAGATGSLRNTLEAINNEVSALVVVVRVQPGADADATNAAVIGTTVNGHKTGLQALLTAEATCGVRPRILGAPGLDSHPVGEALAVIALKLHGFAYVSATDTNVSTAVGYRDLFSARELMLLYPNARVVDPLTGQIVPCNATAIALGARARIDQEQGWHKSISNVDLNGVVGLNSDVQWDFQSTDTEAAVLNGAAITCLIKYRGFRFWGNRTCSNESLFEYEVAVRTGQVLKDTIADGLLWAIDKPITPSLVKDIVETINVKFRQFESEGRIIGARAWFNPAKNSATELAAGRVHIDFDYTPCAPLEALMITQTITDSYYADFGQQIAAA